MDLKDQDEYGSIHTLVVETNEILRHAQRISAIVTSEASEVRCFAVGFYRAAPKRRGLNIKEPELSASQLKQAEAIARQARSLNYWRNYFLTHLPTRPSSAQEKSVNHSQKYGI